MAYLSSEQAMADYAELLTWLKNNLEGAKNSRVVAFGGSYGAMLAALMRVKYPHIVEAALASSAPLQGCFPDSDHATGTTEESRKPSRNRPGGVPGMCLVPGPCLTSWDQHRRAARRCRKSFARATTWSPATTRSFAIGSDARTQCWP
ncbi:hypothetical protein MTO96_019648 [Rhipicephalus appendiculatus]